MLYSYSKPYDEPRRDGVERSTTWPERVKGDDGGVGEKCEREELGMRGRARGRVRRRMTVNDWLGWLLTCIGRLARGLCKLQCLGVYSSINREVHSACGDTDRLTL